jgi:hypothetical protein
MPTSDLTIPPYGTSGDRLLGWCLEAVQEGRAWLQTQTPTKSWAGIRALLSMPDGQQPNVEGLSNTGYNKTKRIARELVASLANFRHAGEFAVTQDQELFDRANLLTRLDANWYLKNDIVEVNRRALQYAVADGTSYFWQTWNPYRWSKQRGDIDLEALSASDVFFVQLPKNHDIQQAYGVLIREELPINVAKAKYRATNPYWAAGLVADRDSPGWLQKGLQAVQKYMGSPALAVAGRIGNEKQNTSFPTVDIWHLYTADTSVNETPFPIEMGRPGTNWAYTVPARGDALSVGRINPATGNPFTLPATWDDCAMFPLRRYTIFATNGVGYDGTSPFWHGDVPVARLSFGDWAWEALGSSLLAESRTMQHGVEALMRGVENLAAARMDPAFLYDDTLVSDSWAKSFNPMMAGARAKAPLSQGDVIKFPIDPSIYNIPPVILEFIRQQEDRMDYLTGVRDLVAITKAQQIPGADTIEKLMEMAGPIVQDLVSRVALPMRILGEQRKALYFQFYTTARMITVAGEDGAPVDVQYAPEKLIPYWRDATGGALDAPQQSAKTREFLTEFEYRVTESGINEIHRMTTKLFYMQLMKAGFPLSWWDFAKIAQIPNFGPPPEGTNTVMERWTAQKMMEGEIAVEQQAAAQSAAAKAGLVPPGGAPEGAGGAGEPPQGGQPGAGRPPSFNAPPRLVQKNGPDGPRTTVATSR